MFKPDPAFAPLPCELEEAPYITGPAGVKYTTRSGLVSGRLSLLPDAPVSRDFLADRCHGKRQEFNGTRGLSIEVLHTTLQGRNPATFALGNTAQEASDASPFAPDRWVDLCHLSRPKT